MNSNTTSTIVNGRIRSMRLDEVIKMFINLLESNEPREDHPAETTRTSIDPGFNKNEYYSRTIWNIIQNSKCEKMIVTDDQGATVATTTDIDIMYLILAYYNAWIEDCYSSESGIGFCWRTENDEWYSAVFA